MVFENLWTILAQELGEWRNEVTGEPRFEIFTFQAIIEINILQPINLQKGITDVAIDAANTVNAADAVDAAAEEKKEEEESYPTHASHSLQSSWHGDKSRNFPKRRKESIEAQTIFISTSRVEWSTTAT